MFKKQAKNSGTTLQQLRLIVRGLFADKKQLHDEKNLHNPIFIGVYCRIRHAHGTARQKRSRK